MSTVTNNAPANFPVGTNTVTWTVTDASGNTATCAQRVVVHDTQAPSLTCPADVSVNGRVVSKAIAACHVTPSSLSCIWLTPLAGAGSELLSSRSTVRLDVSVGMTMDEVERRLIVATLAHVGGDKTRAAAMLRIGLRTLYRKIKAYAI